MEVWQESVALATFIYEITDTFPKSELYGLTSQMRRAAISVPSNIAEGAARFSSKEFCQFLNIAGGSLSEIDTQIEIASNLKYLSNEQRHGIEIRLESISKKLAGLITHIRKKTAKK